MTQPGQVRLVWQSRAGSRTQDTSCVCFGILIISELRPNFSKKSVSLHRVLTRFLGPFLLCGSHHHDPLPETRADAPGAAGSAAPLQEEGCPRAVSEDCSRPDPAQNRAGLNGGSWRQGVGIDLSS